MSHGPWLELAILISAIGAIWVAALREAAVAWRHAVVVAFLALLAAVGASWSWAAQDKPVLAGAWASQLGIGDLLAVDNINAPMVPVVALVFLATIMTTVRAKLPRFSLWLALASETLQLMALAARQPWLIAAVLAVQTLIPLASVRSRGAAARLYLAHMIAFVALLALGCWLLPAEPGSTSTFALVVLTLAVLIRMGVVPFHTWVSELFQNASFGTAILFATPMPVVALALRVIAPAAPDALLRVITGLALFTALYSAAISLVQNDARRFFSFLLLSHGALIVVGMGLNTPIGLTGAMCTWISVTLALTGFGLTLRAVEAREGRLSLAHFHGLATHTPMLAGFFLLTGLASVGFPGTIGFVAIELVVDGAVHVSPLIGAVIVLAAALNSIAILQIYFRCFTGTRMPSSMSLACRTRERWAIITLGALLVLGGLYPRFYVMSRYEAAQAIDRARAEAFPPMPTHLAER